MRYTTFMQDGAWAMLNRPLDHLSQILVDHGKFVFLDDLAG